MRISPELGDLIKAWLAISIAFGILLYGDGKPLSFSILIAAVTVGVGFLVHELAHRHFARKFRKHAEFRANNFMLFLAILMSFFGFVLAAPGAVIISGFVNRREGGIIASAGPAANLAIALIFLPLILIIPTIAYYGLMINAWLALFNLIPFLGFDGHRIFEWNKIAYFLMLGLAIILNVTQVIIHNLNPLL
jgi:Zn-dependent protease